MPRRMVRQHPREHELFCGYLKMLRTTYARTQQQVAQALNLSRSQYTALEGGRSMLTFDHLCGLAAYYKLDLSELAARKL